MGTPKLKIAPVFVVRGADEVLGTYPGGTVGVTASRTGKATTVFCGPYQTDLGFLMSVAKRAGVHLYSDSRGPMEANERFFTLHARTAGTKTIRLPRKTCCSRFERRCCRSHGSTSEIVVLFRTRDGIRLV